MGGIALDLVVQKEAFFFGLTGGMQYIAAQPSVSGKFNVVNPALVALKGYDAAIKMTDGDDKNKAIIEAGAGVIMASSKKEEFGRATDDAEKAGVIARFLSEECHDEAQGVLDKLAKDTKDEEWSVSAEHGPMFHFGLCSGMNFTDKLSAAFTIAPAFRNFKYEIKHNEAKTISETGLEVGVLGALRVAYKLTDMFSVFGEIGYALFFSEGKPAGKSDAKKSDKKADAKKENKETEQQEKKDVEAKESAEEASKAAVAHKVKTHVPGNVFFVTGGVSVKLM